MIEPISVADTAARLTGALIRCNHGVQCTQSVQWWSRGNVFRILSSIHCADTALWLDSVFLVRPKTFSSTNHLKSVSFEGYTLLFFIDQKPDLIWKYNIPSMPWFEDKDVCICERTLQQNLWHSLSKSPLSGTSDLSQSEIMSDLILSQDGIDAVWLQIWKLGPDNHYITHHENQHHQTSKI